VAAAAAQTINRLKAIEACLLNGSAVTATSSSDDVVVRACRFGGTTYLLTTNSNKTKPAHASIGVKMPDNSAQVLWEGRKVKLQSGSITDTWAPLATHVYKVLPVSAPK
jgi:hypothetical protein